MDQFRGKLGYICDMDGVIYHGNRLLPGVKEFVDWLYREGKQFLFLTNSSQQTPRELQDKSWRRMGLEVDEKHFYTSALATARFHCHPGSRGAKRLCHRRARGCINALYDRGHHLERCKPGLCGNRRESSNYNYDSICKSGAPGAEGSQAHRHQLRPDRPHGGAALYPPAGH